MQQYPQLGFEVRPVYCLKGVGCCKWEGNFLSARSSQAPLSMATTISPPPETEQLDLSSALQAHLKEVGTSVQSEASDF